MGNTLGCLTLVLAAAAGAAPPQAKPGITYQFRTAEVHGLSWRSPGQSPLTPVAHHGAVSVWTAPGDFLETLPKDARGEVASSAKVLGSANMPAHLTTRKEQAFTTKVSWNGSAKAPKLVTEKIREGIAATVVGRKLDQGVLVQLVIDDTDIRAVHTIDVPSPGKVAKTEDQGTATCSVSVTASMEPEGEAASMDVAKLEAGEAEARVDCCKDGSPACADHGVARQSETSQSAWVPRKAKSDAQATRTDFKGTATGSQIQLPEIGRASAAGEWLIPEGGVLVIGFGPHTVADAEGKAVVREHLAVITAEAEDGAAIRAEALVPPAPLPPAPVAAPARTEPQPQAAPASPDVPRTAAAIPSLPSRTLPQGVNADGTPAALPPLPEDEKAEPADEPKSDEPTASPQTKRKPQAPEGSSNALPRLPIPPEGEGGKTKKAVDSKAVKSSFSFPQLSSLRTSSNLFPLPLPGAQFLLPLKPFGLKLPFNQKLELELLGRIVPDPDAEEQVVAARN